MADEQLIKPRELPAATTVFADDAIMTDNGSVVGKATPVQIVNAGAPVPTEAEAISGTDNSKRMTPLTVKQVLDNVTAPSVLRAQAWAESDSPPNPGIPGSMSAKSWAAEAERLGSEQADRAEAAAAGAALYDGPWLNNVAALIADTSLTYTVGQPGSVTVGGIVRTRAEGFAYEVADSAASDQHVTTAGGVKLYALTINGTMDVAAFGANTTRTDNEVPINAALAAFSHVVIPIGGYTISGTVTVPANKRLEFLGGWGNLVSAPPAARLIKSAAMTTTALVISTRAIVTGGGVIGLPGNTGDNVQLAGNSAQLKDFFTSGAGKDGVRVGTDGTYANCNGTILERIRSRENGRHGIYVHDGVGNPGLGGATDANAGTITHPVCTANGGDGIKLGHCKWVTIVGGNTEINTGYGLHLSGAESIGGNYPECWYANIFGGDYNEGNVAGQVYDQSYFSIFINSDGNQFPTNDGNSLQGSGRRACFGPAGSWEGGTTRTADGNRTPVIDDGIGGGSRAAMIISRRTTGSNGNGNSLYSRFTTDGIAFVPGSRIETIQNGTAKYDLLFKVGYEGSEEEFLRLGANSQAIIAARAIRPGTDNALNLGGPSLRWGVVYAGTGTISTSDEREKQDIRDLSEAEKRVALALKSMVKAYRFRDAVREKGVEARTHIGLIAQEVEAAFAAEGLDAFDYGILCLDEWDEIPEERDEEGNVVQEYSPSGSRYGVRYDEALAFIISAI